MSIIDVHAMNGEAIHRNLAINSGESIAYSFNLGPQLIISIFGFDQSLIKMYSMYMKLLNFGKIAAQILHRVLIYRYFLK
jgi:hypothetical protein